MKPEDIEQMKRDREAGTDGPWHLEGTTICGHDPDQPDCPWIVARLEKHCGYPDGQETWPNGRRLVRIPDLEAEVLLLRETLAKLAREVSHDASLAIAQGPAHKPRLAAAYDAALRALNGDAP